MLIDSMHRPIFGFVVFNALLRVLKDPERILEGSLEGTEIRGRWEVSM